MKFVLFRHGHSLANQESRIVSSLENGTRADGGPEGTGFGLSSKGRLEVAEVTFSFQQTRGLGNGHSMEERQLLGEFN